MDEAYINLLELGASFGLSFLDKLKNKAPADLVSAGIAFFNAVEAHKNDLITKANLEAQRG